MTALTQDLALSCLHNDCWCETTQATGDKDRRDSTTAHLTPTPKGSSLQWTPHAVELVLVMPKRQLDWHREEYGQGMGESTGVVALSRTASTKERAASTDSELLRAYPYIWAYKWSCRSTPFSKIKPWPIITCKNN